MSNSARGYRLRTLAWDSLRLHPVRTIVGILSIAVTLGASLTLIGVSESLETAVSDGYAARRVDLILMQAGKANPLTSRLEARYAPALRSVNGVKRVQPLLVDSLLLNADHSILVYGWEPSHPDLALDRDTGGPGLAHGEVLIGSTASTLTGLVPGDPIELNLSAFEVAGLFEANSFYESGVLFMRLDDLQPLIGASGQLTFIFLELDPALSTQARDTLIERIETLVPGAKAVTSGEFLQDNQMTAALRGLSRIIVVTNAILAALIVGTIMVLTVSERRRELAVLRAIGWSAGRIAGLVVYETVALSILAALLGAGIGWAGLNAALLHLRGMGFYAESILTPMIAFGAVFSVVVVALLGATIPVYHTLGIRVSEALRSQ